MRSIFHFAVPLSAFAGVLASAEVLPPALAAMSVQQRKDIGVDQMNETQKSVLNRFILDAVTRAYTAGLAGCSSSKESQSKPRVPANASPVPNRPTSYVPGGEHWIRETDGGKIITLEDGSLWQINAVDQVDTMLWLPVTNIVVLRDEGPVGSYILLDKDDGERAHAKFLGRE